MNKLNNFFCTLVLFVCASSVNLGAQVLRNEAQAWWKPPTADQFRQIRLRVFLKNEPVSGVKRFHVGLEIPAVIGLLDEPNFGTLEVQVLNGPLINQPLDWTPSPGNRKISVPVDIDTSLLEDGWHRVILSGIVTDPGTQIRMVELEVSFQTSNGNTPGNGVPQGPRVSQIIADGPEQLVGVIDTEIVSPVPPMLPSTWQPDMHSQAVINAEGIQYSDPTLLLTFDHRPGGVRKAYMQANEWPVPSPDF